MWRLLLGSPVLILTFTPLMCFYWVWITLPRRDLLPAILAPPSSPPVLWQVCAIKGDLNWRIHHGQERPTRFFTTWWMRLGVGGCVLAPEVLEQSFSLMTWWCFVVGQGRGRGQREPGPPLQEPCGQLPPPSPWQKILCRPEGDKVAC